MSRLKVVVGLAVLCALALSAITAAGASAAEGTTSYTCVATANGQFKDAHCLEPSSGGNTGSFSHVVISKATNITGTNAETGAETKSAAPSILTSTASGLVAEIVCTTVGGTGTMENAVVSETMVAKGGGTITYSGCTAPKPTGQECKVKEGKVVTSALSATTEGTTEFLKFSAPEELFANVTLEGCKTAGLNIKYPVKGSVKIKIHGATLESTEAEVTTQNTLKFNGQKAGLEGKLTLKGENGSGLTVTPG